MNPITPEEALELFHLTGTAIYPLLHRAHQVRMKTRPETVNLCGIMNAKSGHCTEDCRFCAQSVHNDAQVDCYALQNADAMIAHSEVTATHRAARFGIVTSGLRVEAGSELDEIATAIRRIRDAGQILPCASLGNLTRDSLQQLKDAGLTRYHCNLETARSFYPNICTTRDWEEAAQTVRDANAIGLATCCGGLFGLGESLSQRVELLVAIRDMEVDSVPLNFFRPVPGTRVSPDPAMTALECLKIIAIARLMLPDKEIRVCGGREYHLRDLQPLALISGGDGLMVGGYLTTSGRSVETDLQMIRDAGFEPASECSPLSVSS